MARITKFDKVLLCIRGVSGSSKSTYANYLKSIYGEKCGIAEADNYFIDEKGEYKFDATKLYAAHKDCQKQVEMLMVSEFKLIIVSNTSTTIKELKPYFDLAEKYKYEKFVVTMNRFHEGKDVHDLPQQTIQKQINRFEHKLY